MRSMELHGNELSEPDVRELRRSARQEDLGKANVICLPQKRRWIAGLINSAEGWTSCLRIIAFKDYKRCYWHIH